MENGSLGDYLGYNNGTSIAANIRCNAHPVAAYLKIFDEWYRDQNLQETQFPDGGLVPGDNNSSLLLALQSKPLPRSWQHDYFTSCLPFPQKGPDVKLPIFQDGDAYVQYDNPEDQLTNWVNAGTDLPFEGNIASVSSVGISTANYDPNETLKIDGDDAGTIRSFRRALKLQEFYERLARAGSRYSELILNTFGIRSGDARLNRPELIGGTKQNVVISEVLSTAQTVDQDDQITPIGQMGGHGISVGGGQMFKYTAREHGWIIGITSVRPTTSYYQGLHPSLTRMDMFDYPWPDFAHIGEQEVKNKELYLGSAGDTTTSANDLEGIFGYIPRYGEMRFMNGSVHGEFKDTLAYWHMARTFDNLPALNSEFLNSALATTRIFAVEDPEVHHIYAHIFNNITVRRALPKYTDPSL